MGRYTGPTTRLSRREGQNLFLKGTRSTSEKSAFVKKPQAPGMHGNSRTRLSDYGLQLREKQKAKRIYRILEKQFKLYFDKAAQMPGEVSENLLQLLELRLDNLVYRLGFAISRDSARQLVNHGHITVDSKKISIPSAQVKVGQKIGVALKVKEKEYWKTQLPKLAKAEVPGWLSLDPKEHIGQVISAPTRQDLPISFDPTLIVEFYSR